MAIRTVTFALAAAAMTVGTGAQAAAVPARTGASLEQAEHLGSSELIPVLIFMASILAIMLFLGDDDEERPTSP